jgi:hypothetical protein
MVSVQVEREWRRRAQRDATCFWKRETLSERGEGKVGIAEAVEKE